MTPGLKLLMSAKKNESVYFKVLMDYKVLLRDLQLNLQLLLFCLTVHCYKTRINIYFWFLDD